MISDNRLKIAAFMKLWEYINRVDNISEFEFNLGFRLYKGERFPRDILDQVVKDFYEMKGIKVTVEEIGEHVNFEKEIINEKENLFIEFLTRYMGDLKESLNRVPKKNNLFYFDEEQTEGLLSYISDEHGEKIKKLDIIKSYMRTALELGDKDAVFLVNDKLYVRYYKEKEDPSSEKRFGGIPGEEMERLKQKFVNIDCESVAITIGEKIVKNNLKPEEIDNVTFQRKLVPTFQKGILNVFKKHIECEDLQIPFSNYILRNNFNAAIHKISEYILSLIPSKKEEMKKFISFYDGSEFFYNNKKVLKWPVQVNKENLSFPMIYSTVSQKSSKEEQHLKKEGELKKFQMELENSQRKIENLKNEEESLDGFYKEQRVQCDSNHEDLIAMKKRYQDLQIEVNSGKASDEVVKKADGLKKEIDDLTKRDARDLKVREDAFKELDKVKIEKAELGQKINSLNNQIPSLEEKAKELKNEFEVLKEKKEDIIKALGQAIIRTKI